MLLKSPFIDAERTFNVAERRFNIAEYRKKNRCCYFFSRAPMLMILVSKTIYR